MRSVLVDPESLEGRRADLAASRDLAALDARLRAELDEFARRPLYVPEAKALLSRWGSACHDDGAELGFDPWSPQAQRCTACGRIWSTEQSHRWWVDWYQLWLAERCWMAALLGVGDGEPRYVARAQEVLAALAARYLSYPNADNVLGPSRPFFSTYLESIWVLHLAASASLLAAHGRLPADLAADLATRLFRPSADLIADFDERGSNRQVWNAAALFALGDVLGDGALRRAAARGPSGILATLEAGVRGDGLWYEGENYHWFALRGLVWGVELLRTAGETDLWTSDADVARKFREAFRAPVLTALPDFTSPARRDSRFGIPLRHRRVAELWELARARSGDPRLAALLDVVYDERVPVVEGGEGLLSDVERTEPASGVRRARLGWKGWLWMPPAAPTAAAAPGERAWPPAGANLAVTGIAVFRPHDGRDYVSLDYGEHGGGHGHADRLNLTLHAGGVPWLVDFGTGSYVSARLGWYRGTLAHNAPLVDGVSQLEGDGVCVGYADAGDYGWICAQVPEGAAYDGAGLQRTVVVTPDYVLDVVQMSSTAGERPLALPWHGWGRPTVAATGVRFERDDGAVLPVFLAGRQPFQVQLERGPGPTSPGAMAPAENLEFAIVIAVGEEVTLVACVGGEGVVEEVECHERDFVVRLAGGGMHTHRATDTGWQINLGRGDPIELGGVRELGNDGAFVAFGPRGRELPAASRAAAAQCLKLDAAPALDGSLDGFRCDAPLVLDREDQFRRAEEPWGGPDSFSATAYFNHQGSTVFVAVEVVAAEPEFRPPGAADPEWENENPDIHSDGLQLYLEGVSFLGWLVVPDAETPSRLRVSTASGTDAAPEMVRGAWAPTPRGYRVTLAVELPEEPEDLGVDLCVNRFRAGRERRVGQLVWSGARGSRLYLAGDRPVATPLPVMAVER